MPDPIKDDETRTFTERELAVLVADRVQTETAAANAERDEAKAALTAAQNKADASEVARAAAEDRATAAETALAERVAAAETAAQQASLKDARVATVKAAATHLKDEFFADAERITRICAMDETQFAAYVDDLKAAAGSSTPIVGSTPPRSTAMDATQSGTTTASGSSVAPAAASFLNRHGAPAVAATV